MSKEVKICINCKHYRRSKSPLAATQHLCARDAIERTVIVTGESFYQNYSDCQFSRISGACGPEGKYFLPKES